MLDRLREFYSPGVRWFYAGLAWFGFALLFGALLAFRCVRTSSIGQMIQLDDIPLLHRVAEHYATLYWIGAGCGLGMLFGAASFLFSRRRQPVGVGLCWSVMATMGLGLYASRYAPGTEDCPSLAPTGLWDWLFLLALAVTTGLSLHAGALAGTESPLPAPLPEGRSPGAWTLLQKACAVYLLCALSVFVYAFSDHLKFWNAERNGGFHFETFFQPDEKGDASLVLFSTSMLFASLSALVASACFLIQRALFIVPRGWAPVENRRQTWAASALWSVALMAPWQTKLYPEISAEGAWILPVGILVCTLTALTPLCYASLQLIRQDLERTPPEALSAQVGLVLRRSESAFLALLLFPVYPVLRALRAPWPRIWFASLWLLAAGLVTGLTWFVNEVEQHWDFDDWRGMLKSGLFPSSRVFLSLLAAWAIYLAGRRILNWVQARAWGGAAAGARRVVLVSAGVALVGSATACLVLASWPFWGWRQVHRNVFTRLVEFSDRHKFELGVLRHFADLDHENAAGGKAASAEVLRLPAKEPVDLPPDGFTPILPLAPPRFTNLVLLILEGVTPRSVSAYGQRQLKNGAPSTPHLDRLAREGMLFSNARCCYPSTWDAWFALLSGRFLRIQEMDASKPFGDRYTRYNNLHKVLKQAGINRWCYSNCVPFADLFLPAEERQQDWEPDLDTSLNDDEEQREIWRGDKRNSRLLRFLDSIQEGERFFLCEHLADTHFPWRRTSPGRAHELGFPDGLEFAEEDARVDGKPFDLMARYYQTVTRMDGQVGQILDKLREKGLYDQSLIVVVSDHGCQWYEHEHAYYVSHLYEQSLRVPLVIRVPGFAPGLCSDAPVLQPDLLQTVMELAGIQWIRRPGATDLDGTSLVPLLQGNASPEQSAMYHRRDVLLTTHYDTIGALQQFRFKLVFDRPSGVLWLFDLEQDPLETRNLVDTDPERLQVMLQLLRPLALRHMGLLASVKPNPASP